MLKKQMVDLLLSEPEGQIIAYNALATRDSKIVSEKLLKDFFSQCLNAYQEDKVTSTDDLISQFELVASGKRPIKGEKKIFLLKCDKISTLLNKKYESSNVIEFSTLKGYIINYSCSASGHGSILTNPDPTDPCFEESIKELNNITNKYQINAKLGGNSKRPFFWITNSNILVRKINKRADYIRDILGLIHYEPSHILIEIKIPGRTIIKSKNARPTFMDALSHTRFRIKPDTVLARQRSAWGCTVDLNKLALKKKKIDGLPERIVNQVDCTEDLGLSFSYIGEVKTFRGDTVADDDIAFVKYLRRNVNFTSLKQEILDILS